MSLTPVGTTSLTDRQDLAALAWLGDSAPVRGRPAPGLEFALLRATHDADLGLREARSGLAIPPWKADR